jgi:hypothetical protein
MPTLVLQRGHVARTTGATGGPGEQQVARRVAAAVAGLMPHAGWQVRVIDADEPLVRYRGDAFVSLHCDASSNASVGGASVGWRNTRGRELGAKWKAAYRKHGWPFTFRADNYTAALAGYYGHRHAVNQGNLSAVIVEHGFTTNPVERRWIESTAGIQSAALAVVEAVTGSVPGPTVPPTEEVDTMFAGLKQGDRSPRVEELQRVLNAISPREERITVDGQYGPATRALVVARTGVEDRDNVTSWMSVELWLRLIDARVAGRFVPRGADVTMSGRLG